MIVPAYLNVTDDGRLIAVANGSTAEPGDDPHRFAAWAYSNAGELVDVLGPGIHSGIWARNENTLTLADDGRYTDTNLHYVDGLETAPPQNGE